MFLIVELLKRFTIALFCIPKIIKDVKVIYSITSVLDSLLLPFVIKIFYPKIRWVALFENEVFLKRKERWVIRSLAYGFYKISLILLKRVDKIYAVSDELKEVLIRRKIDKKKVVVVGNAVEREKISKAIAKRRYWCDGLFLGRWTEDKGVFDLIEITKKVVDEIPDFSLWIAGSGEARIEKDMKQKIDSYGLNGNIKLLGSVTGFRKYKLLANCRIFMFPSRFESFGVALLEAVCSGSRAVVYDLPVYKKIYEDEDLDRVKVGDIDSFSEKVVKIFKKHKFKDCKKSNLLQSDKFSYSRIAGLEMKYFFE